MKSHAVKQTAEIHSSEPLTLAKSKINHRTYILNVSHAPFKTASPGGRKTRLDLISQ